MMISYSTAAPEAAGPVADPFEIHNLASDPKRVEKMPEMREVLDAWIEMCDDPLDMPEDELVRTRVYPPEGEQPTTARPTVRLEPVGARTCKLTVTCETEGAAIGFRRKRAAASEPNAAKDNTAWTIYNGPTNINAAGPVEVIAHRIGFQPGPPVVVEM